MEELNLFWSIFLNTVLLIVIIMAVGYGADRFIRGRWNNDTEAS